MKKTLAAIISVILGCSLLAACTSKELVEDTMPDAIRIDSTFETFSEEEQEIREIYLKLYKEKSKAEKFITDEERAFYEELGFYIRNTKQGWISSYDERYYETSDFYAPVVITGETAEEKRIAYTDEYGKLCVYDISKDRNEYYDNIHLLEDMDYIDSKQWYAVAIDGDKVQLWAHGEKKAEAKLPKEARYVGFCYWEQYLFRSGSEVYSVELKVKESTYTETIPEIVVERIAKGVKYVILADYKLNSDAWEQPLFYMEDGTVKAYCHWEGEEDSSRDDKSHLVSIQYEGGYQ